MITSYSVFYYDVEVTSGNRYINFDEGSGELTATLSVGPYTPEQIAIEVQTQLNSAGDNSYTVSFDRDSRFITISADANFDLNWSSGGSSPSLANSVLGFAATDLSSADTYTGTSVVGSAWEPQFRLQDYVPSDNFKRAVDETVVRSASGSVVVVKFGNESFIELRVPYITNISMPIGSPIKNDSSGYENALAFLNFAITKNEVEFMPDINDRSTYETVLLESTEQSSSGVGFRLSERLGDSLPDVYDSGLLVFRVIS